MFLDRIDAGCQLAKKLRSDYSKTDMVIGLARGGVVIVAAISDIFNIPRDVLVVKKIGSPGNPEFAIGAVAPGGVSYIDETLARLVGADDVYIKTQISELSNQIIQKTRLYRKDKKQLSVTGKTIIIADDGAATGATMYAAIRWVRGQKPKKLIVALPVAPPDVIEHLRTLADDVVVLDTPADFGAVGSVYKNFPQLTDQDVVELLI